MRASTEFDIGDAGSQPAWLRAVPASAQRILDVGCGAGTFGAFLKRHDSRRQVLGIERDPALAAQASQQLDRVFHLDVEQDDPPLEPESLDCILYGDILEHLHAPGEVLRRHRRWLRAHGIILCCVPNLQHHSVLTALLKSDFQYTTCGLLDASHLRFFTYATLLKLLLDSGYAPTILDTLAVPCPPELLAAAAPLLRYLGLHPGRTQRYLSAYQYLVQGTPLPDIEQERTPAKEEPMSFVVCVSNEQTLQANLLSSPCLRPGSPHEVLLFRGCRSAAEGLNQGLARARHRVVVGVHQDVYLPQGWSQRFWQQYRQAEQAFGHMGVVGVYGVRRQGNQVSRAGHVVDRDRLLKETGPLPAGVDTLDELLLAVPKESGLRFEPRLGFHLYGADLCLAAQRQGLATVAVDALCFHNSLGVGLPEPFHDSARVFAAKWSSALPIATPCVVLHADGQVRLA